MLKRIAAVLLVVLSLSLGSCSDITGGLEAYTDQYDGYQFLHPNSWVEVDVPNSIPDVVFRDLVERTENGSVVISEVPEGKTLADLGTPTEVGRRLADNAIAPPDSGRQAELIRAESKQSSEGKTYYILEYAVKLGDRDRHNLASVTVSRDRLFTLNVSTTQKRWSKVKDRFETVARSFNVY